MRPGDPRGPPLAAGGMASTPLYSGLTHRSEPLPRHRIALPFLLIFEATIMAIIYEGGSLPGLTISSRLRLALTLWMGFSVLVLTAGIVFAGLELFGSDHDHRNIRCPGCGRRTHDCHPPPSPTS
jgi:hypothetical protein